MKRSFLIFVLLALASPATADSECAVPGESQLARHDCYTNRYGHERHVPSPSPVVPEGATARCRDGAYSFSEHRSGGKITGIVSIGDLVKGIIDEQKFVIDQLNHYIRG